MPPRASRDSEAVSRRPSAGFRESSAKLQGMFRQCSSNRGAYTLSFPMSTAHSLDGPLAVLDSGIAGGHDVATVVARRAGTPVGRGRPGAEKLSHRPITPADPITAIQDVVGPEGDGVAVATVRHLLGAGLLTRRGTGTCRCPAQPGETGWSHMVTGRVRHPSTGHAGGAVSVQLKRMAGGCRGGRRSITEEDVKRYGRALVRSRSGRGAGGVRGAGGSRSPSARNCEHAA
jgi:hypothetical protein